MADRQTLPSYGRTHGHTLTYSIIWSHDHTCTYSIIWSHRHAHTHSIIRAHGHTRTLCQVDIRTHSHTLHHMDIWTYSHTLHHTDIQTSLHTLRHMDAQTCLHTQSYGHMTQTYTHTHSVRRTHGCARTTPSDGPPETLEHLPARSDIFCLCTYVTDSLCGSLHAPRRWKHL